MYDAALSGVGVTSAQFPILRSISPDSWTPLNLLAARLVMERTSLYRTLKPMVASGWVNERGGRIGEGHAKQIQLTPAGMQVRNDAGVHWSHVQTRMVDALGADRWASLHEHINELATLGQALGK